MYGKDVFPEISGELEEVENEIFRILKSDDPLVEEITTHLLRAGGKRLRPALVVLSSYFGQADHEKLITLAAAVEIVHMATLVHDDVIDDAATRRGWPTVNQRFGNREAILAGDYLFARAFSAVAQLGDQRVIDILSQVVYGMSAGEIRQIADAFNLAQTESDYLLRIYRKTALFIAECCELGGVIAGAPASTCETLRNFGYGLGMGFQGIDDILDLNGSTATLGKPVWNDLREGVLTLPVLRLLQDKKAAPEVRRLIEARDWRAEELERLRTLMDKTGAIQYAYDVARRFIETARQELAKLPDIWARAVLDRAADFILARSF